jgi:hypothetical protein
MRRVSATFLLAVLGFTAVIPLVFADPESSRPVCCRRDGKHQCAMMAAQAQEESSSGPALRATRATCPYFPGSGAEPTYPSAAKPEASPAIFASLISHPAVHAQCEARYRISFTRTHQKRGPPVILS